MLFQSQECAKFTEELQTRQEYQQIDVTRGTYCSASQIWNHEGGMPCDEAAARCHVNKCRLMGPPFVQFNPMTERWDFLYMTREFSSSFSNSWAIFQRGEVKSQNRGKLQQAQTKATDIAANSIVKNGPAATADVATDLPLLDSKRGGAGFK